VVGSSVLFRWRKKWKSSEKRSGVGLQKVKARQALTQGMRERAFRKCAATTPLRWPRFLSIGKAGQAVDRTHEVSKMQLELNEAIREFSYEFKQQ